MATAQKDPKTQKKQDDNKVPAVVTPTGGGKESEPVLTFEDEAKIVAEIQDRSEAIDKEAFEKVRARISEAKQATPEPELTPDLEDAGVVSPQKEANKVISQGASLDLPISEEEYEQGTGIKIAGKTIDKSVVGVSSLVALSMWVGRMIKMAHKHAMRVVFKKGDEKSK